MVIYYVSLELSPVFLTPIWLILDLLFRQCGTDFIDPSMIGLNTF